MTVAVRWIASTILFFSLPSLLLATATLDSTNTLSGLEPSWGQFLKVMFMLVVVIVLIMVTLTVLRKLMGGRPGSAHNVELLGGIPLGPRKSVQFMKIGESLHIIGVTDHHISLLSVIKDPHEIASIINTQGGQNMPASFANILKRFSGKQDVSDE